MGAHASPRPRPCCSGQTLTAAHEINAGVAARRAEFGDNFGQPVACRRGSGVGGADQSELVRALDSQDGSSVRLVRRMSRLSLRPAAVERRMRATYKAPPHRLQRPGAWHREFRPPGAPGTISATRVVSSSPDLDPFGADREGHLMQIQIDGPTRAVLRGFLDFDAMELGDFESYVRHGGRSEAARRAETAAYVCELLDQLGWTGGENAIACEIEIDPDRFALWLRRQRASVEGARRDNVHSLDRQQAGDKGPCYCGHSLVESIAMSRSYIERDDGELRVIDTLLDELSAGAVA
jgi:hypothetical protein